jgi:H+/Cl- antiporter ClcA
MTQQQDPTWLPWIVPLITAAGVAWAFLRRVFSNEAQHKENKAAIAGINEKLEEAAEERSLMRGEVSRIAEDVAYLRGRIH